MKQRRWLSRSALAAAVAAAAIVLPHDAPAAEPKVEHIVHRANLMSYYQGRDGRAQVAMTITNSQGRSRSRNFTILRRDQSETDDVAGHAYRGDQRFYIYFHRPADVSKLVFMVRKNLGTDDDRWLYLPALDLVKRIAASDKRTSFVGSDFFYEDVSGRDLDDDRHELVETTDNFYIVQGTPIDPASVEFAHYRAYIHRSSFIPVQIDYVDDGGQIYRTYKALKVETVDGYPTVTAASMESRTTGSKTVVEYTDVAYDIDLPDNVFTERYLRRAPRQYLR